MEQTAPSRELLQVAERIRELRGIFGYSVDEMARKTDVMPEMYLTMKQARSICLLPLSISAPWRSAFPCPTCWRVKAPR